MGVTTDLLRSSIGIGVLGVRWLVKVVTFQRWRRLSNGVFHSSLIVFSLSQCKGTKLWWIPQGKNSETMIWHIFAFVISLCIKQLICKKSYFCYDFAHNLSICQSVKMSRGGISRTKYYIKNKYINIFIFYKEKSGALLQESPPWPFDRLTGWQIKKLAQIKGIKDSKLFLLIFFVIWRNLSTFVCFPMANNERTFIVTPK